MAATRNALIIALTLLVGGISQAQQASAQCRDGNCGTARARGSHRCKSGGLRLGRKDDCPTCRPRQYGQPDLFYNYYAPGVCNGVPAQLYVAPHPVPAYVGHTYFTYQPLMPHEMMYQHRRTYYRYYNGGRGLTRTSIRYR